uniref:Phosphosulfolactate synthase n=1 Tax=Physcomitrium patens TaxID=3218 RepID=A0A7I4BGW6_PHYPA
MEEFLSGRMGKQGRTIASQHNYIANIGRPAKPRMLGITEVRGPFHSATGFEPLQNLFESMGEYIDGLKFSGGCHSLMSRDIVQQWIRQAHHHDVYVSTGDWAEHVLRTGPGSFKQYVKDCKDLGFDTVEINADFIGLNEDNLLRLIRMVKKSGMRAKPELGLHFHGGENAELGFMGVENPNWVIKRAERYLQAGADMIMIASDGLTNNISNWRSDLVSKIIEQLGLERIMFEASDPKVSEWLIEKYGSKVRCSLITFVNECL